MMKVTGDKEQSAARRAQQGFEEQKNVCESLCMCVRVQE